MERIVRISKGMLKRKFVAPKLPSYHVPEVELTSRILSPEDWSVCLIHAKGGSGKTTLLSQWYKDLQEESSYIALWVSLEDKDMVGASFARVLAVLFQQLDARFAQLFDEFESEEDAHSMLVDLLNLIDEVNDSTKTYFLILDDYDSASSEDLDAALLFLNKNLAENFRLIVAGAFLSPQLDDLLLDSSVLEFRGHDLRFDDKRLDALKRSLLPECKGKGFECLGQRSDGWPIAFVFEALAQKRAANDEDVSRIADSYLKRYFKNEVLDNLGTQKKEAILKASVLDRIPIELCKSILPNESLESILSELYDRNCYIECKMRQEYVFDPLFLDTLRDIFLESNHDRILQIAGVVSKWYGRQNCLEYEAKYLSISCDPSFLEDMAFYATSIKYPLEYDSFTEYLMKQPAQEFLTDSYLVWVSIWSFISGGFAGKARYMMERSKQQCSGVPDLAYRYADALCLALEGRPQESYNAVSELLDSDMGELPQEYRCLFLHMQGEDCERLGRIIESRNRLMKALALAECMDGSFYRLFDMYLLSRHYLFFDDFSKSIDFADRILSDGKSSVNIRQAAHSVLAYINVEEGNYVEALSHINSIQEGAFSSSNIDMYVDYVIAKSRVSWFMGDKIEALSMVQRLSSMILIEKSVIPRNVQYDAFSTLVKMGSLLDDLVGIGTYIDKVQEGTDLDDIFRAVPCMIAMAAYLWRIGEQDGAFEELVKIRERIDRSDLNGGYWLAETYVMECVFLAKGENSTHSASALGRAIELAMRNGYMSVFLDGGDHVKTLLLELITNRKTSSSIKLYARRILDLFGDDSGINEDIALRAGDVTGYYSLTEREREILHLLNSGMSRQELSEHLVISQNTAKTHLKNIYAKLGVHTRAEAYRASMEHDTFVLDDDSDEKNSSDK